MSASLPVAAEDAVDLNDVFTEIATADGLAPLLVLVGTLLIVFSVAVFGALTLGAVADLFTSDR